MSEQYIGSQDSIAYFTSGNKYVAINTDINIVTEHGEFDAEFVLGRSLARDENALVASVIDLAIDAFSVLEDKTDTLLASARLYTIPSGVRAEAEKALEWRKEHKRGGTPVGLNTARTLAKGGQIGIEKLRHIAKYFPRHEVDKKGKGWKPGEDNFPSNGRIAWALWGGDAAWRWAKAIVERENKKALTADANYEYEISADLSPIEDAFLMDESVAPDFLARVRLDGSGIDRIYKVDLDGHVYAWDDGVWDDLGHADGDVWTYDKALDDPYDNVEKTHLQIDPESALIICARLNSNPFKNVSIDDIDEEEALLAREATEEEDWDYIDTVITAAGEGGGASDGYTPEERAKNASKQVRDGGGKFAAQGKKVNVKGGGSGIVTAVNKDTGKVTVKMQDGSSVVVPAKMTKQLSEEEVASPVGPYNPADLQGPLDTSGILGEPRTPQNYKKAQLDGTYPALTREDLHKLLGDFPTWVADQRAKFKPAVAPKKTFDSDELSMVISDFATTKAEPKVAEEAEDKSEDENESKEDSNKPKKPQKRKIKDGEYHPIFGDWIASQDPEKSKVLDPANAWAKPITAAGKKPKKSDVEPVYLAIVAPDDPRAVIECISIVPASETSTQPMTYVRRNKKWERDPKFLQDLKSATPPPVVPLKPEVLNDVLIQIDGLTASAYATDLALMVFFGPRVEVIEEMSNLETLFAAGGLDRNRGQAEGLRRYWTVGKGAAKIRWGTKGDWTRCVRHLSKYMGVRAKGYCQLRHKEATGVYTGSKLNPGNENAMEEVWGENIGAPTVVTDKDLLTPIDKIVESKDNLYDGNWKPDFEIVEAMYELGDLSDEEFDSLTAASWVNNTRKSKKLKRYWTVGRGGQKKIRWNSGGDWTRCVRYLSKYLGPRAKGYCALRHKEMTGEWTGDKSHLQRYGGKRYLGRNVFSTEVINSTDRILELTNLNAKRQDLTEKMALIASSTRVDRAHPVAVEHGSKFVIPLVIPELKESGDGRSFKRGAISWRELPLPLMWQFKTGGGHDGSIVVGRIDRIERIEDGIGNASGVFDISAHAKEVERMIRNGFIRGVSADMDMFEATEHEEEAADGEKPKKPSIDKKELGKDKIIINQARVMGVTIVPKPAFQECKIYLEEEEAEPTNLQEEPVISDGIYVDDADEMDASSLVACGVVAGAIPVIPPSAWFEKPALSGPTPLTVTDEGQVFGHIAAWHVDHIGLARGTKPPRSKSNYAYFHTGICRTEEGRDIPVGQLTLAGGHASLEASAAQAVKHYDDTASAFADVHAGEDAYGIWVAGSLRPGTSPEQIRAIRASAPSGDWRPIRGSLELVAVCQVNVPGFPIARARVASGAVMALVAAGAATLAKMKSDPVTELTARLQKLESFVAEEQRPDLEAKARELSAKFAEMKSVTASAEEEDVFAYIPRIKRVAMAKKGQALPDGSFPIGDVQDLKNAIRSFGRASESKRGSARRHIVKRARALGKVDLIPSEWKNFTSEGVTASAEDLKARLASAEERLGKARATEFAEAPVLPAVAPGLPSGISQAPQQVAYDPASPVAPTQPKAPTVGDPAETVESGLKNPETGNYTPQTQPRDENGKFRKVLARLKQNLGVAGLQKALDEAKQIENLHELGSYVEAANASVNLQDILSRLDTGALNSKSVENVRNSAKELGTVISNLPLGFNNQAQKVRYSDLPPALQDLMDNMVARVEEKIGQEDADIATQSLKDFKRGADVYSQSNISAQMSKLLRLLT
jgi:hypothetical protein